MNEEGSYLQSLAQIDKHGFYIHSLILSEWFKPGSLNYNNLHYFIM